MQIHVQSGAVITQSNISSYYTQHCNDNSRTYIKTLNSQKTPHTSSYGVSFVSTYSRKKTDHVITAPRCVFLFFHKHFSMLKVHKVLATLTDLNHRSEKAPGIHFNIKTIFSGMGIPMIKKQLWGHPIFIMGMPILVRQHFKQWNGPQVFGLKLSHCVLLVAWIEELSHAVSFQGQPKPRGRHCQNPGEIKKNNVSFKMLPQVINLQRWVGFFLSTNTLNRSTGKPKWLNLRSSGAIWHHRTWLICQYWLNSAYGLLPWVSSQSLGTYSNQIFSKIQIIRQPFCSRLNLLTLIVAWFYMALEILFNIGSGNGLLPDGNKSLQ